MQGRLKAALRATVVRCRNLSRTFIATLVCLTIAVGVLGLSVWTTPRANRPRVRPSRLVADTFMEVLCRPPSGVETVEWDSRPFEKPVLVRQLEATEESRRLQEVRRLLFDAIRREATREDCTRLREWIDRRLDVDAVRRQIATLPETRRVAAVRELFIETFGRDPREWDDPSLRRWVNSPDTIAEIRSRLRAQRPLVGVHFFMWYLPMNGWGNGLTSVAADAPQPLIGRYDSSDTDVIATQIKQMEDAGFDFALVHIVFNGPRTWTNARLFMDRLSGHRLKAAIVLDGLYTDTPAAKAMWVQKVKEEYAGDSHYLRLYGQPLIVLYSSRIDFDVPGVIMRNMYWAPRYDPGSNVFNGSGRLEPRDWPFWAPTPQPLANGMVPVIPGYTDAALGRERSMVYERNNGQMYRDQWLRALALHPDVILVYGWNEYFERTAIEPTNVWGDQYLKMTACFIGHAHRGTTGSC
jgi:hypothetical protein